MLAVSNPVCVPSVCDVPTFMLLLPRFLSGATPSWPLAAPMAH